MFPAAVASAPRLSSKLVTNQSSHRALALNSKRLSAPEAESAANAIIAGKPKAKNSITACLSRENLLERLISRFLKRLVFLV